MDPHSEWNFQCLFHETLRLKTMRQFPRNRLKLLLKMLELSRNATPGWILLGRFQGPAISWFWVLLPLLCSALVLYICSSATLICSSAEDLFLCPFATDLFLAPLLKIFFFAPLLQIWSTPLLCSCPKDLQCTSNLLLSYLLVWFCSCDTHLVLC